MKKNTDTKAVTLQMPLVLYSQLHELARIANRTPGSLALYFASSDVEQCYAEPVPSLDVLAPLLYSTMREAAHVADAANAWQVRYRSPYRKHPYRYEPVLVRSGKYQVWGRYRKEGVSSV